MNETTTSMGLTGMETAISLFEILGILLPLVGVLMQVMIRIYLTEDHNLSYRRQIGSLSFIMLALVVLILTGGGFLTYIIRQPISDSLTLPLVGFGLGLALVVLAVFWIIGDVMNIIKPPSERGYPPATDPHLDEELETSQSEETMGNTGAEEKSDEENVLTEDQDGSTYE